MQRFVHFQSIINIDTIFEVVMIKSNMNKCDYVKHQLTYHVYQFVIEKSISNVGILPYIRLFRQPVMILN